MTKPYRVYRREGSDYNTFFLRDIDGTFVCTHGGWHGTHIEPATLKHVHGEAKYDSYEDLTKEEYQRLFYGYSES